MLISVHIPKTGGTTFKIILEKKFKERLLKDYDDRPMSHSEMRRKLNVLKSIPQIRRIRDFDCIHGHFLPYKYRLVKNPNLCIWFRDPVQRIISRYHHYKRSVESGNLNNVIFEKYIQKENLSLEEFCKIEHFQNTYSKYLWRMNLEDFNFIGITDNYDDSLIKFKEAFDIDFSCSKAKKPTPRKEKKMSYDLPSSLKSYIIMSNKKDMELYSQALRINNNKKFCLFKN